MHVVAVNPNATPSMSDAIARGIDRVLAGAGKCIGVTNLHGPPAIQGPEDGARAVPGVLRIIHETVADGFVIACFDDTALEEARAVAPVPVVGIGQASYHMAALLRPRFAVVTTLAVSVPVIEGNIAASGFAGRCAGVHASGVPVLRLAEDPAGSLEAVSARIAAIERAVPDCAIVLGCSGMAILKDALSARHDTLILDPVECAGRLLPALVALDGGGA